MHSVKGKSTTIPVSNYRNPLPDIPGGTTFAEREALRHRLVQWEIVYDIEGDEFARVMRDIHLHRLVLDAPMPWINCGPSATDDKNVIPEWMSMSSVSYLASMHGLKTTDELMTHILKIMASHGWDWWNDKETREAVEKSLEALYKERDRLNERDQQTRFKMRECTSQLPEYLNL